MTASISMPYKSIRENFSQQVAIILSCYRKNCSNQSPAGQLILPESLKLLPMYANCLLKSDAVLSRECIKHYLISVVLYTVKLIYLLAIKFSKFNKNNEVTTFGGFGCQIVNTNNIVKFNGCQHAINIFGCIFAVHFLT